ncbi:MAG: DNRLRE domain-containing protein [Gallionella sp.]|nr:DNRLRE domain-containing protein [Gallionella sp.]
MSPRTSMAGFTLLPVMLTMTLIAAIAFLLNRDNGMNAGMVAGQSDAERARYTAEAGLQMVNALSQAKNCAGYTDLGATTFDAGSVTSTINPKNGTPVTLTATATTTEGALAQLTRANVIMHQTTPYTIKLQPGTNGSDTSIGLASPNVNHGADPNMSINIGQYVSLVQFDLSTIPAGSVVQSAQFSLYHASGGTDTAGVFTVTRPWSEGTGVAGTGATWNSYDGVNAWTAAGGDYDPTSGINITLPVNNAWASWDLTAQTAAWKSGSVPNYGVAVTLITGGTNTFASSDNGTDASRPKLVVTFLPPCGWVPNAGGVTLPAIKDTWINETNGKTNTNYGGSISFTVTTNKIGSGLVQFDLSTIPAGKLLKSAKLRLFAGGFGATTPPTSSILTVYPVTNYKPWTELGVTWKTADGSSNSWGCGNGGGGCFGAAAATASISSSFTPGSWVEWDVTALAQEWYTNPSLNYGVGVLMDPTSASAFAFNSKEATFAPQYVPQLVITW